MSFKNNIAGVLLLLSAACFAQQNTIAGETRNSDGQMSLPYVNIGVANKSMGTVSSAGGKFLLKTSEGVTENDTVVFSHIGFRTKKLLYRELSKANNTILLEPDVYNLDEVVISMVKPKPKRFGRGVSGLGLMHCNFYAAYETTADDRLSKELGMKFSLKKDCKMQDLNFKITSNEFKSVTFRLNFYKVEDGQPAQVVGDKEIIFEVTDGFLGWYKLDLKPYELYLDKEMEDFAVTIQWIASVPLTEQSKYFGLATAVSATETSFYREKTMDTWRKSGQSLSFFLDAMCR